MKVYTYITDHPRNRLSKTKLIELTNEEMRKLDERSLLKLYVLAHRTRRDKAK